MNFRQSAFKWDYSRAERKEALKAEWDCFRVPGVLGKENSQYIQLIFCPRTDTLTDLSMIAIVTFPLLYTARNQIVSEIKPLIWGSLH